MIPIFDNPSAHEQAAKEKFSIPPFIMMENAAHKLAETVQSYNTNNQKAVHIFCGKGNNGADGLALARLLQSKMDITIYCPNIPTTEEGSAQYTMAKKLEINILSDYNNFFADCPTGEIIIVDCIYGIGFHGELPKELQELFTKLNSLENAIRIACDVPSGLGSPNSFKADCTVTMGQLKSILFTDCAKALCGKIITADLGISKNKFESVTVPDEWLITEEDIKLPFRDNISAHKGTYGHTVVFAGEKSGAAIINATAAMNFGSGLTSLFKTNNSNLEQFKISPELMICSELPAKTTSIAIGSGLGSNSEEAISTFVNWFENTKNPACVIDADMFSYPGIKELLDKLNKVPNARIVLTPHLKELQTLLQKLDFNPEYTSIELSKMDRNKIGREFTKQYNNCTLVMKSSVTYIANQKKIYICNKGCQSLAKGGSGDVLAGMITALLAQGYTSIDAALTAVYTHAQSSSKIGQTAYDLTPEKLINNL